MGNNSSFSLWAAQDADGTCLEVGDWVECTTAKTGGTDFTASLGRITHISTSGVTFEWKLWGTYIYNDREIQEYGLKKVFVDASGWKIKEDQLLSLNDGQEAMVTLVDKNYVTLKYSRSSAYGLYDRDLTGAGCTQNFKQRDLDYAGVVVRTQAQRRVDRGCAGRRACV
mmetsp:Transcript_30328/g.86756  ORF Transcript_30328/g.86756 Transcript_30328/m.86756 type:complete len:169 (-) Transcript_30328:48-554(-)|eukprot:CAMPEP_0177165516 /NCGR_PEP_ID=MMETSP0367-20130122/7545_1 /TAXON_ID=447022 ORGANISM="Scrippsiella hangoei-like, Strain SHHI-4" /NCGR_SAMPLE_ID=MMETSP0367 /ASSEMBLY_ACC=CAM_ASM_000362 /LENGTH=168 /DNA_ID=CAMNT_0018611529 /DNA_START=70 /DNA_END=576 /DNA_ORIENTATION=+